MSSEHDVARTDKDSVQVRVSRESRAELAVMAGAMDLPLKTALEQAIREFAEHHREDEEVIRVLGRLGYKASTE